MLVEVMQAKVDANTDSYPLIIFQTVHIFLATRELELEFCLDSDGYFYGRKTAGSSFVCLCLLTNQFLFNKVAWNCKVIFVFNAHLFANTDDD